MGAEHKKKGDPASIYYGTGALHCCTDIICWRSEEGILLLVDKPCACLYFLPGSLYIFDYMSVIYLLSAKKIPLKHY